MKQGMYRIMSFAASVVLLATTLNVNSTCQFFMYQPKLPQGVQKLVRHR